ncbi:MAG: copper-binding protein [Bacteroidota bacterium]|nr:copper-binding protein [Bacteroidota bacterium]MDP4236678.1 copper-binding protein [Bacteroidota bacterium]
MSIHKISTSFRAALLFLIALAAIELGCNRAPESTPRTSDSAIASASIPKTEHRDSAQHAIAQDTAKTYRVLAKVTAVDRSNGTITIDHERLMGLDPMKMAFPVSDTSLLGRVRVGTEGHFTIQVSNGKGIITGIHVHAK